MNKDQKIIDRLKKLLAYDECKVIGISNFDVIISKSHDEEHNWKVQVYASGVLDGMEVSFYMVKMKEN